MGRKRNRKKNIINNNADNNNNDIVNLDENDNEDNNDLNNIISLNQEKRGRKRRAKGKRAQTGITEITLDDSDGTEEKENTNTNIDKNSKIMDTFIEKNEKENKDNNNNDLVPGSISGLGLTNSLGIEKEKEISIYNPSGVFSNNLESNINKNNNNNLHMNNNDVPKASSMPMMPSLPGAIHKDFISSLINTLIKHYGYETLVNSIINRKKSNDEKLDEFVDFLLNNNSYTDVISCLINSNCEQEEIKPQSKSQFSNKNI